MAILEMNLSPEDFSNLVARLQAGDVLNIAAGARRGVVPSANFQYLLGGSFKIPTSSRVPKDTSVVYLTCSNLKTVLCLFREDSTSTFSSRGTVNFSIPSQSGNSGSHVTLQRTFPRWNVLRRFLRVFRSGKDA